MIEGLSSIADRYDAFIIDIFGVIHDGLRPFPHSRSALLALKDAGKRICLLSNSPKRADGAAAQMASMGLGPDLYDHIVTSGEATYQALLRREDDFHAGCGLDCWFIGTPGMMPVVQGIGLTLLEGPERASFILNAIPGTSPTDKIRLMQNFEIALKKDLPMICANPDLVVNIGDTQYECAGTFAAAYAKMGGRVLYHGKPHAPVYERCLRAMGMTDKSRVVALGDSLHTDVAGARGFGIGSVFVLSGIHRDEIGPLGASPLRQRPERLETLIKTHPHKPDYVITQLVW